MKFLGVFMIFCGCLTGLPAVLLLAAKPVIHSLLEQAQGFIFAPSEFSEMNRDFIAQANILGGKLMAAAILMIGGGYYLTRPANEPEDE